MTSQDDAWAVALLEVESDARQAGLWARCFAQADGDENKAKAAYISERVALIGATAATQPAPPLAEPDGVCPNCGRGCMLDALTCPHCAASFAAGSTWKPRLRQQGEVLVPDRPSPAVPSPATPSTAEGSKKGGTNWLLWIIGVPVGLFFAMLIIGAMVPKEKADQWAREQRLEEACEQMLADSALGAERRMTRQICDGAKAQARSSR